MKNLSKEYTTLLENIKRAIQAERTRAIQQLTRSLILIYWDIGKQIIESQAKHGWGKSIVEQLSKDLQATYPGKSGYSAWNLWDMRRFYETYKNFSNLRQLVAEIPWGHHLLIMQKIKSIEEALRTRNKPLGVSEYKLSSSLLDELSNQLPSPEELVKQLKNKLKG